MSTLGLDSVRKYQWSKSIASISICAAGAYAMYISDGETGIGWAVLGLLIIWG